MTPPQLKVITPPTSEPITIEEAKDHMRVTLDDDDYLIAQYIAEARGWFERQYDYTIYETTYEVAFQRFPTGSTPLELPRATPLVSVTSVKYTDSDGTETTWSSDEYVLDLYGYPGNLRPAYNESYPSFTAYPVNPILVRYTAGSTAIREDLKGIIRLLVAGKYENRESESVVPGTMTTLALRYGVDVMARQFISKYVF
jgi:uncharacterized phiE125 gp8 family phage protein